MHPYINLVNNLSQLSFFYFWITPTSTDRHQYILLLSNVKQKTAHFPLLIYTFPNKSMVTKIPRYLSPLLWCTHNHYTNPAFLNTKPHALFVSYNLTYTSLLHKTRLTEYKTPRILCHLFCDIQTTNTKNCPSTHHAQHTYYYYTYFY